MRCHPTPIPIDEERVVAPTVEHEQQAGKDSLPRAVPLADLLGLELPPVAQPEAPMLVAVLAQIPPKAKLEARAFLDWVASLAFVGHAFAHQ
jgi:hypothetical protein